MQRVFSMLAVLAFLFTGATVAADRSKDYSYDPTEPTRFDPLVNRVLAGDYSSYYDLSAANRKKVIRLLKDRIYPQDEPGDPKALAIGAVLVKLRAEKPLHDLILELYKEGSGSSDRERSIAFDALSFMKSKGAVRALASFLHDTIFWEQAERFEKMDNAGKTAYLKEHPVFWRRLRSNIGDNLSNSLVALCKMGISGAPKTDYRSSGMGDEELKIWQNWWELNKRKFQGEGPLPDN